MNLDMHMLEDTINDLKNNPDACTTMGGATQTDGTITIPESHPGEQLKKFIAYLYDNDLTDHNYVENVEKIKDKKIEEYSYEETITALTKIIRGDRFSSGFLYSNVKDGTMLKLVEKLISFANSEPNMSDISANMARMMNYQMHAEQLFIPVLSDFEVKNDNNPQTIVLASGHGFTEQLVSDGHIEDGEFEKRIELVINNTKDFMRNNGLENVDNSFLYYKDYNNGVFDFKLYIQDLIIPVQNEKKVIRQFNAYFVEPRMHDFYQLSLSAGPFTMPTETLKVGVIDLENDQITKSLDNLTKTLMDNLKYKN